MSSAPPGKRIWNCPDCGGEVLLSITQLDPLACPTCVTKLKGGSSPTSARSGVTGPAGGPLQIVAALPESVKLAGVGCVALLLGLLWLRLWPRYRAAVHRRRARLIRTGGIALT